MNSVDFNQAWSGVLDSESISEQQLQFLLQFIKQDKKNPSLLADDLAIHRILRSGAEFTDNAESADAFVARCDKQIRKSNEPVLVAPDIRTREPAPARVVGQSRDTVRRKRRNAKWTIAALTAAAAILVGCFVVVWQNNSDLGNANQHAQDAPTENQSTGDDEGSVVELVESVPESKRNLPDNGELPQLPDLDGVDRGAPNDAVDDAASSIAVLLYDASAVWGAGSDDLQPGRIGAGRYSLSSGLAMIRIATGESVLMKGPAELKLLSAEQINLVGGEFLIQVKNADEESSLAIETRDILLAGFKNSQVQLEVNDRGSEVLLSAGTFDLARKSEPAGQPLKMAEDLVRAFVNNVEDVPAEAATVIPVVIASGPAKYFAQVGLGDEKKTASSAADFKTIVEQHLESQAAEPVDELERFHKMFDGIRKQFEEPTRESKIPPGFSLSPGFQSDSFKANIEELRRKYENLIRE